MRSPFLQPQQDFLWCRKGYFLFVLSGRRLLVFCFFVFRRLAEGLSAALLWSVTLPSVGMAAGALRDAEGLEAAAELLFLASVQRSHSQAVTRLVTFSEGAQGFTGASVNFLQGLWRSLTA